MKLRSVALFASGYVLGARAGRERYAQILSQVAKAERLEEFSARRPLQVNTPATFELTAVPDRSKRLSQGVLLEGSILARFLGLRLLRLDTVILIAPADVPAGRSTAVEPPIRASTQAGDALPRGSGLSAAVRDIDEGRALLAAARRNGPSQRQPC
ncbi:MAG: hypothetical protein JO168_19095 [Solirubrobacterales bacterium]|nr:hypothetical protein [Solirubrobacterales bacterium]